MSKSIVRINRYDNVLVVHTTDSVKSYNLDHFIGIESLHQYPGRVNTFIFALINREGHHLQFEIENLKDCSVAITEIEAYLMRPIFKFGKPKITFDS